MLIRFIRARNSQPFSINPDAVVGLEPTTFRGDPATVVICPWGSRYDAGNRRFLVNEPYEAVEARVNAAKTARPTGENAGQPVPHEIPASPTAPPSEDDFREPGAGLPGPG